MPFRNPPGNIRGTGPDDTGDLESGVGLPWASDPAGSYLYYDCSVGCMLDSGIVVHNRLPQVNKTPDSLSSVYLDAADVDKVTDKGVNLRCQDQYADIVQRMGHARYWFRLWGQALRIGYRVPIPAIKLIGGVAAVPYDKNPQWAFNSISPYGNYGGIPLWRAVWSLWFTTIVPTVTSDIPEVSPSAHISGKTALPGADVGIQAPYTLGEGRALAQGGPVKG